MALYPYELEQDSDDDEAKFNALIGELSGAAPPPVQPPPVQQPAAPPPEPPPTAAAQPVPTRPGAPGVTLHGAAAQPELYKAPAAEGGGPFSGDEGAMWAALADVALNQGRGTGQILQKAYEQRGKRRENQLSEDYRVAQINSLNRGNQGRDPRELELRALALEQGAQRLQMQGDREARLLETQKAKLKDLISKGANGEQIAQYIELQRELGVPENILATLGGMSMDTARVAAPQLREQSTIAQAPQLAQAAADKTAATTGAKLDVEHAYAPQTSADKASEASQVYAATIPNVRTKARESAAGTQEGQGDYKERRFRWDQARAYQKDNEHELAIGGLINEINQAGGAAPKDFAERFKNDIAARGIDPARLEPWQAKQMVLEIWSRKQTGAAISATEAEKFDLQAGMGKTASAEQIQAAYNVMDRLVQRQLRAAATNNPTAREILFNAGVTDDPDMYLGLTPEQAQANAKKPVAREGAAIDGTRQTALAQPPAAAPGAAPRRQRPAATPTTPPTEKEILEATQLPLGTTGGPGVRATPALPVTPPTAAPAAGARMRRATKGSQVREAAMTDKQAEALTAAGWKVEG